MINISLNSIDKYYGAELILSDISFEAKDIDRIGIVGENGCGKTTLFKIISEIEKIDKGSFVKRKGTQICLSSQIPNYPSEFNVTDIIYSSFSELQVVMKKMRVLEEKLNDYKNNKYDQIIQEYGELQSYFELKEGYKIEEKIKKICNGLNFSKSFLNKKFNSLSGGEKSKVELAKVLVKSSDVLLLDEPTNHLDLNSIEWLEEYLKLFVGTVMVISHDRFFLDKITNKIFEIENKKLTQYFGNYTSFIKEKRKNLEILEQSYKIQQKKINKLEDAVARFQDWGSRKGNEKMFIKAENMKKRIERIDKIEKPKKEKKIKIDFIKTQRSGNKVFQLNNVSQKFNEKTILKNLNQKLYFGDRVAIIGENGTGKSTLINIIIGNIDSFCGNVFIAETVKIGFLPQEIVFDNTNFTVIEEFRRNIVSSETKARNILANFKFKGEDVFKKISQLSGGEKVKLYLSILLQKEINFLILDEPTNHLDITTRDVLEKAIEDFNGTLLFISHDRYFLNSFAQKIFEIENGRIFEYLGNFDYYKEKKSIIKMEERDFIDSKRKKLKNEINNKNTKKPNKWKQENIEEKITLIEERVNIIDNEIDINSSNYEFIEKKLKEKESLNNELEILYVELEKYI